MAPEQKSESFLLRMGASEVKMLEELADNAGMSRADIVRQLIRREHASLLGTAKAKKKPKR